MSNRVRQQPRSGKKGLKVRASVKAGGLDPINHSRNLLAVGRG